MTPDTTPPPSSSTSAVPAPEPPAPTVQVPIAPIARVLTFFTHPQTLFRHDLNNLAAEEHVSHHGLRLAIGYDHRIYSGFDLDHAAGVVRLTGVPGQAITLPLRNLSIEEVAALRFLEAVLVSPTARRTHGWRAHLVEVLGGIVPIFNFEEQEVEPARLAAHFRSMSVLN